MVELIWDNKKEMLEEVNSDDFLKTDKHFEYNREESKNFDTTENLYIEGDNLDALKLLQKDYNNKIKMIYIDPPYNTERKFIYNDTFRNKRKKECRHSGCLNMMYPRLRLARNLLSDNGIIFVSIDNNEVDNMKKICNEIFGEENFIEEVIWKNKYGSGAQTRGFIEVHEYILCYSKKIIESLTSELSEEEQKNYNKKDEKYSVRGGYMTQPLMTRSLGDRENLKYSITYQGEEIIPNKQWVWSKERLEEAIANNEVEFNRKSDGNYSVRAKKYLYDEDGAIRRGKPISIMNGPFNQEGTQENRDLFKGKTLFDFTKPSNLIKKLISIRINEDKNQDFIVLDFFSGSSTTAHAVMQMNAEDKGNRKFIMVQLPEECAEKSEAFKAGYKNICEIGKERIRRAGDKIVEENKDKEGIEDLDIGFKVIKIK